MSEARIKLQISFDKKKIVTEYVTPGSLESKIADIVGSFTQRSDICSGTFEIHVSIFGTMYMLIMSTNPNPATQSVLSVWTKGGGIKTTITKHLEESLRDLLMRCITIEIPAAVLGELLVHRSYVERYTEELEIINRFK